MREPIYRLPPDLVIGEPGDFLPSAGEVNWGMEAFGVDALRSLTDGAGVKVGIVDTGATPDQHPLLANVADSRDFTGSRSGSRGVHPHGCHVTGTVGATDPRIGVGVKLTLYHGKGLGDSGSGTTQSITGAMDWLVSQGCVIISGSLGSPEEDPDITGRLREYAQQGVWPVFAAGNSGPRTADVDWPARSPFALSTAALNRQFDPASFTNAGDKIDMAGPGEGIMSTMPGGQFGPMSGTSMSTPFNAGVLGLYRSALVARGLPIPGIEELRRLVAGASTDTFTPGRDRRTGPGWFSPLLLALALTPDPPPVGG